ncbi:probable ATP-dependent RNA helicase ddx17 isoform X2 [Paramacrobiotus metropolitanus]|uniref:probable ATP-dependent RNA helicase ddx17 isoform X2 n=1 Tax=Paramacrobiotus metropolitanus TaxID=2943436 RepID=UPI00244601F0|nr:probable ATP-dependent RNA helicase ddx17 isoform X2 [Paramacrobiotus metropolitanus]
MVAPNWDFLGFYFFILLSLVKDSLAIRCYECNPGSSFGIGGSGTYSSSSSSSSSSSTSGQQSDCYNADSRQIRDCAWDVNSCFTVVFPGPTTGTYGSGVGTQQSQFTIAGNQPYGNPYTSTQGLVAQRGCGKYQGVYNVGDEECQVVTLPNTQTRATVCNCRSDSCNSRRPDQVQSPLSQGTGFYPTPYGPNTQNYNTQTGMYGPNSPYNPSGSGPYYGSNYYPYNQNQYPNQNQYNQYNPNQQPYYPNQPYNYPGQGQYPGYSQPGFYPPQNQPGYNNYPSNQYGSGYYNTPGRYGGAASALTVSWMAVAGLLLLAQLLL